MKKYVLTGGPSIGKTTIIEILANMGYKIIPEAARTVIDEERAKDSDILPWKNLQKFQDRVAEIQFKIEEETFGDVVFLDRSIIDGYGYCKLGKVIPPKIVEQISRNRYDKIFVLESLNKLEKDGTRFETESEAEEVHRLIIETYKYFGYEPIFVPALPPKERTEYILNLI